jgi:hypothetical protein
VTVTEAVEHAGGAAGPSPGGSQRQPSLPASLRRWTGIALPHLIGVLVVTAVHAYAARDAVGPVYSHDEIGYLMNGRALSGNVSLGHLGPMGFYRAGWPLLTLPLHWLLDDPASLYRAVLWEVAVLGGLQVLPLSWLADRVLGVSRWWRAPLATVAAIVPGRSVLGGYVFAEAAYALAFLVVLVCVVRWRARSGAVEAAWLGSAAGFVYAIHGKGSAVVALTLLLLLHDLVRSRNRAALWGVATSVLTVAATQVVHQWLRSELYDLAFDRTSQVLGVVGQLQPRATVATATGGAWYVFVATAGVAAVGAITLGRQAWADAGERRFDLAAYYLASGVGLVVVSLPVFAVIVAKGTNRLDFLVYGRHWDSVVPFAVLAGLATVTTIGDRRAAAARILGAATLTATAGLGLHLVSLPAFSSGLPVAPSSIGGLAAWIGPSDWVIPIFGPTVLAIGVLAVSLVAQLWGRPVVPVLVGAVFVVLAVRAEHRFLQPFDAPNQDRLTAHRDVERLAVDAVGYDLDGSTATARNSYQYWMPDVDFLEFDSTREAPPTELVLARPDWPLAAGLGAVPVTVEERIAVTLWILPGELQDRLRRDGGLCTLVEMAEATESTWSCP